MNTNANEKTKVSLETLAIYDTKIKQWVKEKQKVLFFSTYNDFPSIGEQNILYIDGSDIYVWYNNAYKKITNNSPIGEYDFQWKEF